MPWESWNSDYDTLEGLNTIVLSEQMILKLLILNPSKLKYSHG